MENTQKFLTWLQKLRFYITQEQIDSIANAGPEGMLYIYKLILVSYLTNAVAGIGKAIIYALLISKGFLLLL